MDEAYARTVTIIGAAPSAEVDGSYVRLKFHTGEDSLGRTIVTQDAVKEFTVVGVNLGISGITSEEQEENPGRFMGVNNNDDNNDGTPDNEETGTVEREDDLVAISLSYGPTDLEVGQVNLAATKGSSKIKVWESATKGSEVNLPATWNLASQSVPSGLYVEGVDPSGGVRDVELTLSYTYGEADHEDLVAVTVYSAELKSIKFTSDHDVLVHNDSDWTHAGSAYSEPEWEVHPVPTPNTNNPISHTKDTAISLQVRIKLEPSGLLFDLEGNGPNDYVDFSTRNNISTGADQTMSITADANLPNQIAILTATIAWKVILIDPDPDVFISLGDSGPHKVYVTYGMPLWDSALDIPTDKRIAWGCQKATGQDDRHEIVNSIQGAVQTKPPYFAIDQDLSYRITYASTHSFWEMLAETESPHWNRGDCVDFAKLIRVVARTLGADSTAGAVMASRDDGNSWNQLDTHSDHADWTLYFVHTPGFNPFEGAVRLEEQSVWYYYTSVPDLDATHLSAGGGSINLTRAYVLHYPNGNQEYYDSQGDPTGIYEPLPPEQ